MGWMLDSSSTQARVADRSNVSDLAADPFYRVPPSLLSRLCARRSHWDEDGAGVFCRSAQGPPSARPWDPITPVLMPLPDPTTPAAPGALVSGARDGPVRGPLSPGRPAVPGLGRRGAFGAALPRHLVCQLRRACVGRPGLQHRCGGPWGGGVCWAGPGSEIAGEDRAERRGTGGQEAGWVWRAGCSGAAGGTHLAPHGCRRQHQTRHIPLPHHHAHTGDLSRNNWWVSLVSFGEGWHK